MLQSNKIIVKRKLNRFLKTTQQIICYKLPNRNKQHSYLTTSQLNNFHPKNVESVQSVRSTQVPNSSPNVSARTMNSWPKKSNLFAKDDITYNLSISTNQHTLSYCQTDPTKHYTAASFLSCGRCFSVRKLSPYGCSVQYCCCSSMSTPAHNALSCAIATVLACRWPHRLPL